MPLEIVEIRDLAALETWNRRLWTTQLRKLPEVRFALHELSRDENRNASALAAALQRTCGCTISGLFMSVTVVTALASYFLSGNRLSDIKLSNVVALLGMTVGAAFCGKVAGLLLARFRLLRLAIRIRGLVVRSGSPARAQQAEQP